MKQEVMCMNVNNISFKSNLLEQMQPKAQTATVFVAAMPVGDKNDSVELSIDSNKKKSNKKTITGAIAGIIILAVAFVKRKAIVNFFKRLFNKAKIQTDEIKQETEKAKATVAETTAKAAEKIEFPRPKFTCGLENPEQNAAEKKAYVDSIMPFLYKRDKQLNIKAIEAIEKYGTWEHGDKLGLFLGKRDEDIVVPVVRAIASTGGPRQVLQIYNFIATPENYSPNTYFEIFNGIAKLGDMKKLSPRSRNNVSKALNVLKKHENPEIAKKANETLKIIFNK